MSDPSRKLPAPQVNPETQPFWDAAARGVLMIKRCRACGEPHYYPRALCPFCFSNDTVWQETSGEGAVYSFSVMRRAPVPYIVAYVTLAEGVTMLTNIVGCGLDEVAIGRTVRVTFMPSDGGAPLPMFTPA